MKVKNSFDDLADGERAIVDFKARNPNTPNTEIAEALETNRSYVSQVVNTQSHLLEEQRQKYAPKQATVDMTIELNREDIYAMYAGIVTDRVWKQVEQSLIAKAIQNSN